MPKHRRFLTALLAGVAGALLLTGPARAADNPDAKLLLHLVPLSKTAKSTCTTAKVKAPGDVLTHGDLDQEYLAYVMIAGVDTSIGMAGVQFGISYDGEEGRGVDISDWQDCVLYEWPMEEWPAANSGNLLTWSNNDCQHMEPLVVGYFTVVAHSPDRLKIIPRPVDGLARVVSCGVNGVNAAQKLDNIKLENLGWADFGDDPGYNPWDPEQNLLELQNRFKPIRGNK